MVKHPRSLRTYLILLICPLLLLALFITAKLHVGPYWYGANSDPEYVYLFNSLNVALSRPIVYVEHPGTPLQTLGGFIINTTAFMRQKSDVLTDVLQNPEIYLTNMNYVLLSLIILVDALCGLGIFTLTGSFLYAIVFQLTPFFSTITLELLYRATPEALLLSVNSCVAFVLFAVFMGTRKKNYIPTIILGALTGLSTALKINSLPIVIIPLIVLSYKEKLLYLVSFACSCFLFTLPIIHRYQDVINRMYTLLIHSGSHGNGPATVIDVPAFYQHYRFILTSEPIFIVILFFCIVSLMLSIFKYREGTYVRYTSAFLIYFLVSIAFVSKHYSFHYLVPYFSLVGATILLLLSFFRDHLSKSKWYIILAVVFLCFYCVGRYSRSYRYYSIDIASKKEVMDIQKILKEKYSSAILVSFYRNSSPEFALNFGNRSVDSVYGRQLNDLYGNRYFYGNGGFSNWTGRVAMPTDANTPLLFQGTPLGENEDSSFEQFSLTEIYTGTLDSLYLLNR